MAGCALGSGSCWPYPLEQTPGNLVPIAGLVLGWGPAMAPGLRRALGSAWVQPWCSGIPQASRPVRVPPPHPSSTVCDPHELMPLTPLPASQLLAASLVLNGETEAGRGLLPAPVASAGQAASSRAPWASCRGEEQRLGAESRAGYVPVPPLPRSRASPPGGPVLAHFQTPPAPRCRSPGKARL